jgi:hypothetical protein
MLHGACFSLKGRQKMKNRFSCLGISLLSLLASGAAQASISLQELNHVSQGAIVEGFMVAADSLINLPDLTPQGRLELIRDLNLQAVDIQLVNSEVDGNPVNPSLGPREIVEIRLRDTFRVTYSTGLRSRREITVPVTITRSQIARQRLPSLR